MQNTHTLHNIPPAPQEKGPILEVPVPEISEKVKKVAEVIKKTEKAPMFCPKHNGMRVGLTYSCGCSV